MENAVNSAAVSALLYGLAPGSGAAEPAVQFARQLLSGNSWKSSSPGSPPLQSVFTHLNGTHAIPPEDAGSSPQERMESLRRQLRQHTEPWTSSEIPRLLRLLEQTVGGLPCHDAADISLYDYQKITAALASCAAGYLAGAGSPGSCLEPKFRDKKACLLYSADFSGIQKFLFTVATKGALPSLRSRSFFLELLMEHYIDELLSACGASRVNLLYAGGGHCYILLPNTPQVLLSITAWNTRFNDWLAGQFGISLFLADGWTGCSGNELMNIPAEQMPYTAMFRRVSAAIARRKLRLRRVWICARSPRSAAAAERRAARCKGSGVPRLRPFRPSGRGRTVLLVQPVCGTVRQSAGLSGLSGKRQEIRCRFCSARL